MQKTNYITPAGHKRLSDELDQLSRVERPEITALVQWAASNGDRSENADYLYGKKRLREIDKRLRFLSSRLEAAQVVDPAQIKSTKVQFGATVELIDEEGQLKVFSIVGIDEVNTAKGHISWQSPIGKSLLGKSEGDEVLVKVPVGEITFEIRKICYQKID